MLIEGGSRRSPKETEPVTSKEVHPEPSAALVRQNRAASIYVDRQLESTELHGTHLIVLETLPLQQLPFHQAFSASTKYLRRLLENQRTHGLAITILRASFTRLPTPSCVKLSCSAGFRHPDFKVLRPRRSKLTAAAGSRVEATRTVLAA